MPRHTTETGFNQINIDAYGSFAAAISAIGSNDKELVLAQSITISSNLTVPRNVLLTVKPGAIITINNSYTLTLNCDINAGKYQIFAGDGYAVNTTEGAVTVVYPEWFGAVGDFNTYLPGPFTDDTTAIQKAIDFFEDSATGNGGTVLFANCGYKCTRQINLPSNVSLVGQGGVGRRQGLLGTVLAHVPDLPGDFIVGDRGHSSSLYSSYRIENLNIFGDYKIGLNDYSGNALYLKYFWGIINNLFIRNFKTGLRLEYTINGRCEHVVSTYTDNCLIVQGLNGYERAGTSIGPSTTITFHDCYFSSADDYGVIIVDATDVSFINCISESHLAASYYFDGVKEVRMINPFFEDDYGPLVYAGPTSWINSITISHPTIMGGIHTLEYTDFFWLNKVYGATIEISGIASGTRSSYVRTTTNTGPVYFTRPYYPDGGISIDADERVNNTHYNLGDKIKVDDEFSYKTPKTKRIFVCVESGTTDSVLPSGYCYSAINVIDGSAKFSCAAPISSGGTGLAKFHIMNSFAQPVDKRAISGANAIQLYDGTGETVWELGSQFQYTRDELYLLADATTFLCFRAPGQPAGSLGGHGILFGGSGDISTTHRFKINAETEFRPTTDINQAVIHIQRTDAINRGLEFYPDGQLNIGLSFNCRPATYYAHKAFNLSRSCAFGATPDDSYGLYLGNTTAAANGVQQISPAIYLYGRGWGTSASKSEKVAWRIYNLPLQGSTAGEYLYFDAYTSGWGVDTWYNRVIFDHDGGIVAQGNIGAVGGVISMNYTGIDIDPSATDIGINGVGNYPFNIVSQRASGKYNLGVGIWSDVNAASINADHKLLSIGWINNSDAYQECWKFTGDGSISSSASSTATLVGSEADSGSAICLKVNTSSLYSTSGAKLLSVCNNGTEKLYIDKDGLLRAVYGLRAAGDPGGESSTLTLTGSTVAAGAVAGVTNTVPTGYSTTPTWVKVYVGATAGVIPVYLAT